MDNDKSQNLPAESHSVEIFTEDDKSKSAVFWAGGNRRHMVEKAYDGADGDVGEVMVNGRVVFADKTTLWCVLIIDESSSGELLGMGAFLPGNGFSWQGDKDFLEKLGKSKGEVWPYRYRYDAAINAPHDHHVGEDGWSTN